LAETFPAYGTRLGEMKTYMDEWFLRRHIDLSETLNVADLKPERLVGIGVKVVLYARDAVSGWALMILLVVFMLGEATDFPQKLFAAFESESETLTRVSRLNAEIRQHVFIMTWSGFLVAVANAILLILLGIPFAPLWAVLSFFMAYIPAIGFIIALIPPTLLALLKYGWQQALIVIGGYVVIRTLVFSVVKPVFAGKKLNLSRIANTVSVVLWVWVLGPIGALLALPMTLAVKDLLLERSEEGRVLAAVMGADSDSNAISGDGSVPGQVA
jgi:predicted PurR-regulated permease PerM